MGGFENSISMASYMIGFWLVRMEILFYIVVFAITGGMALINIPLSINFLLYTIYSVLFTTIG